MKDLIIVTAYCPTEEQENALEKCIDSVLKSGTHIALISHSHVPIHIQKKCQYYFYDYNNEISYDYDLLDFQSFYFSDNRIRSIFFSKYFYGLAIYRMFSIGSQIAINFGYQNIHHIEYDCELLDSNLILENSKLLETYDSVIYTDNGKEDGFLFGSFKSFKVESLPNTFKNYNAEFIKNEIKNRNLKHLEFFTKDLFINSGKVFFDLIPSDDKLKKGQTFYHKSSHYTLYYNSNNSLLNIFYKSNKDTSEEILVLVNKERVVKIDVQPHTWYIKPLGIFDEINEIRIDNSEKVIYQKSFNPESREVFKTKSYILNEQNN